MLGVLHAVHDLPGLGCWMTYWGVGVLHAMYDLPGLGCWMTYWSVGGLCPTWLGVLGDLLGCCMQCVTYLAWGVGVVHDLPGLVWCMQCMTYLAWGVAWSA